MTNHHSRGGRLWVLAAICVAANAQAQNPGKAFADGCPRQSPETMRPLVIEKLDAFEVALRQADLDKAHTAKSETEGAATDVAGWSGAMAIKCLNDQDLYRRYFTASESLWGLQFRQNPDDMASKVRAMLWSSVNDGVSADVILTGIPDNYRQYGVARDFLGRAADAVAYHRDAGAFVIAEENAVERQARGHR